MTTHRPYGVVDRIKRHVRITTSNILNRPGTPFLILFINSICNLSCGHCFYWRNLNRRDDLTFKEIKTLSLDMGRVENLNLTGGEPFLRPEFAEICGLFIRNNGAEQIYVTTNGYYADKTVEAVSRVLEEKALKLFVVEISLDGMEQYHNKLRESDRSFQKALETYDALAAMQARDPRLRIHVVSTANAENLDEIHALGNFLVERCPKMDHQNVSLLRGDRKAADLRGPELEEYSALMRDLATIWFDRSKGRYGGIVPPMLESFKLRTAAEERQVVPCRAGYLSAVVYSNGDVSVCESRPPIGNLRESSFGEIWKSAAAGNERCSIQNKECHCTGEIFLWSSIVYNPMALLRGVAAVFISRARVSSSRPARK